MAIAEITVEQLAALIETGTGNVRLVDVREADEWMASHIAEANHVPLATVPDRLDVFGPDHTDQPTYVVCRVGGRSLRACEFAAAQGKNVVNVAGGMMAWWDAGYDAVSGS